mgnify:CR=1 FL=1
MRRRGLFVIFAPSIEQSVPDAPQRIKIHHTYIHLQNFHFSITEFQP